MSKSKQITTEIAVKAVKDMVNPELNYYNEIMVVMRDVCQHIEAEYFIPIVSTYEEQLICVIDKYCIEYNVDAYFKDGELKVNIFEAQQNAFNDSKNELGRFYYVPNYIKG